MLNTGKINIRILTKIAVICKIHSYFRVYYFELKYALKIK